MGQYYLVVNISKKQFLDPHKCGEGLKLMEFACGAQGTLAALAILLADGNNRGGGDLHSDNEIIGSWAGDRIVIAGDYADEGRFTDDPDQTLYAAVRGYRRITDGAVHLEWEDYPSEYVDVSYQAMHALLDDPYVREDITRQIKEDPSLCEHAAQWFNPPPLPILLA